MMVPYLSFGKPHNSPPQTSHQTIKIFITTRQIMLGLSRANIERLVYQHGNPHLWTTFYQDNQIRTDKRQLI